MIDVNKNGMNSISAEVYVVMGSAIERLITNLMDTPEYKSLDPAELAHVLSTLISKIATDFEPNIARHIEIIKGEKHE